MPFVKGDVNINRGGRPKKGLAFTTALETAVGRTREYNGKMVSGKKILAELMADALLTGTIMFPGDTEISKLSVKDWMELAQKFYAYVEPPITRAELTGANGGAIEHTIKEIVYEVDKPVNE